MKGFDWILVVAVLTVIWIADWFIDYIGDEEDSDDDYNDTTKNL
jgi:hypothetical protein